MSQFAGDRHIPLPIETVAAKLSDAAFLVGCIDKIDQLIEATADRAVVKLKTGFSFLSASLEVTITVVERTASSAKFRAFSKGVGATSVTEATLTFAGHEQGTNVNYVAAITERTGLLKVVSAGLIQSAAKNVIEDTWKSIEAKIHG